MKVADQAYQDAYAKGRVRRAVALLVSTGIAVVIALLIYLSLNPSQYVARWDDGPVRVSEDGRTVHVVVTGRDCDDSVLFEVGQSDTRVRLTAVVTQHLIRPCGDEPVQREFSVQLGRPLGERPLVDGRCTREDAEATAKEDCPAEPVHAEVGD